MNSTPENPPEKPQAAPRTWRWIRWLLLTPAILATLIRGARFEWDGRHLPEPVSRVTLQPKGGMPLAVTLL